jgi:hypothetical protein
MRRVISLEVVRAAATSTSPPVASAAARSGAATATAVAPLAAASSSSTSASDTAAATRPRTWGECLAMGWGDGSPCPWVGCRKHLLLEVRDATSRGQGLQLQGQRGFHGRGGPRVSRPSTQAELDTFADQAVEVLEGMTSTCALRSRAVTNDELGASLGMTGEGARRALRSASRSYEAEGGTREGLVIAAQTTPIGGPKR